MTSATLPPNYEPKLQGIFDLRTRIGTVHPFLQHLFPVDIVEHGQYQVYDLDPAQQRYQFVKAIPVDGPLPERVRASFPLAQYDNRPVCVVTGDIFAEPAGYVTIFHRRLHIAVNHHGFDPPYGRVTFYAGGSSTMRLLETQEPALTHDIERLFHRMLAANEFAA